MLKVITKKSEAPADETSALSATLDDLARDGARRMIAAALQVEVAEYLARFREAPTTTATRWSCATAPPARAR